MIVDDPHPKSCWYSGFTGTGYPAVVHDAHGQPLDRAFLEASVPSKDLIVVGPGMADPSYFSGPDRFGRPDIIEAMREINPKAKILCHVIPGRAYWPSARATLAGTWLSRWAHTIEWHDGYLYHPSGRRLTPGDTMFNVNMANPFLVPHAAQMAVDCWGSARFDGLLVEHVALPWGNASMIDYGRAGCARWDEFVEFWHAAYDLLWESICDANDDEQFLIANAGASGHALSNGTICENFTRLHGGVAQNMAEYLMGGHYQDPHAGILFAASPAGGINEQRWRFTQCCAALGNGWCMYGPSEPMHEPKVWQARKAPIPEGTFGVAKGPAELLGELWWRRSFENGTVYVNAHETKKQGALGPMDAKWYPRKGVGVPS